MYTTKCPIMKAFTAHGTVKAVPCGRWQCPRCSKANARKWAWRAMLQLDADPRPCRFWTLTMPGGYKSPAFAFSCIPGLWDAFRKLIQRSCGNWTYLAFVEGQAQRNGMPHFHILSYAPSPYRLKDVAAHVGFGYMAKDLPVQSKQAAVYVAKYASKGDPAMPKGFRRVRASQDWEPLPFVPHEKWLVQAKMETLVDFLLRVEDETGIDIDILKDKWLSFDLEHALH